MKMKRVITWGLGVVVVVVIGLYAEFVRETLDDEPFFLVPCVDANVPLIGWACKQVLRYGSLRSDQVENLNHDAGARYPVYMKDTATAEQMLVLFIARGVNINAGNARASNWTALDDMVSEGNVERAKLLIKYGARADIRNKDGETALDFALRMQQKYPAEPNRAEMVRLLEATEQQQGVHK